jgi:hypothetical protein
VREVDAEPLGDLRVVRVVGDHDGDVDGELTATRSGQEVDEAVRLARHQDADARHVVGEADGAVHVEAVDERSERGRDLVTREVATLERELDPLEEDAVGAVGVLLGVDDVAAVPVHEVGDRGHHAGLVGTRQE